MTNDPQATAPHATAPQATKPGAGRVAVITGASSGIGAATAAALAADGWSLVLGARRVDKLTEVAEPLGATALPLDVTDDASVRHFCDQVATCDLLVSNAGGALGIDPVATADLSRWQAMYESNVLGAVRVTQALLPKLEASGDGQVITISSIAGHEPYEGGGGYNAAKHAISAVSQVLRYELLGKPVRVCEICPGMVNTDFSLVRLGDQAKADAVYEGMDPLVAADIAEIVAFCASRPAHVNLDRITVMPRDQASAKRVWRT